jgi:hypothetical protein
LIDFVADDATDSRTANGSDRAAARKNGTADSADTRTDRGVLILS